VNGAVFGGSAGATSTWVNRKMQPPTSTPMSTTQIGEVTLTLLRETVQARTWYELYVVAPDPDFRIQFRNVVDHACSGGDAGASHRQSPGLRRRGRVSPRLSGRMRRADRQVPSAACHSTPRGIARQHTDDGRRQLRAPACGKRSGLEY
jgi:hypothetical protein